MRCLLVHRGVGRAWRRRAGSFGALSALVVLAGLVSAQAAAASTLSGYVMTAAGQPVAGAFIAATGPNGQAAAITGACGGAHGVTCGEFSLTLPDGTYRLDADTPGSLATVTDGVVVSGTSTHNLTLTASSAKLTPVPVYGGGQSVAADGTPGVFYIGGGNVGNLYRSVDYGGTWTQVTVASDDATNGLSEAGSPDRVTTSGFPGEVAASIGPYLMNASRPGGVYYSTDYGVTWKLVGNSPTNTVHGNGMQMLWAHAGTRSVLLVTQSGNTYVADMTAANPSFVQMSTPYALAGRPIAVADGADQPWLATVDSTGLLSVYPLFAQAAAPAAALTLAGFPTNPVAVAIGGQSAAGVPPSAVLAQSASAVAMTLKAPSAASYPAPVTPSSGMCSAPNGATGIQPGVVTPDTNGSYGAAVIDGCWLQDLAGTITAQPAAGDKTAIDAGYDATNTSAGTDAVVLYPGSAHGVTKLAASSAGVPVSLTDQTAVATPGTDPGSAGFAVTGITAATVYQTTFGPAGESQLASAMDVGGVASDDGGATFQRTTYDAAQAVAWWQGASGNLLLYGLAPVAAGLNLATGFLNWTSATPPVGNGTMGGNVSGSSAAGLGTSSAQQIDALAGVAAQDMAFVGAASGNAVSSTRSGGVSRVSLTTGPSGPSFSNVTPIGAGVINKPGPLIYCPSGTGSASTLQDVLLVLAADSSGGAIYRVTGATGVGPTVTQVESLPGAAGAGLPAMAADCGSGTVLAGSGSTLLESTDGGQTFSSVAITLRDQVRALAITPGNPSSMFVGDASGYIQSSADGGQTWTAENDPENGGVNLSAPANFAGGLWDLVAPASGGAYVIPSVTESASADLSFTNAFAPRALAAHADLVAGPGEYAGNLAAPATTTKPVVPAITAFALTHTRFTVTAKSTPITGSAAKANSKPRKPKVPSGSAFVYTLSAASTAIIVIDHASPGRLVGKKCVAQTRKNTKKKRCTIYTLVQKLTPGRLAGKKCVPQTKANAHKKRCTISTPNDYLTRTSKAGPNTVPFGGRIGTMPLTSGNYLATIAARIGSGPSSKARSATFTIVKA